MVCTETSNHVGDLLHNGPTWWSAWVWINLIIRPFRCLPSHHTLQPSSPSVICLTLDQAQHEKRIGNGMLQSDGGKTACYVQAMQSMHAMQARCSTPKVCHLDSHDGKVSDIEMDKNSCLPTCKQQLNILRLKISTTGHWESKVNPEDPNENVSCEATSQPEQNWATSQPVPSKHLMNDECQHPLVCKKGRLL